MRNSWKRVTVGLLALALVAGGLPANVGGFLTGGTAIIANAAATTVNLAELSGDYEAKDSDVLTGTLAGNYKITVADGATITLKDVTINGVNDSDYAWAGITPLGDATIILEGKNIVRGFYEEYPGIFAAEGHTLTIQGNGSLYVSANGDLAAAIGGGCGFYDKLNCGNIVIKGGDITAVGSENGAGIGSGESASCGDITIFGCTVNASGGEWAAGIGAGCYGGCGNITIKAVTSVTVTKGEKSQHSIGASCFNDEFSCGTVTIGDTVGAVSASPYTYSSTKVEAKKATCTEVGNIEYYIDGEKYYKIEDGKCVEITQADTVKTTTVHDWNDPTYSWTATENGYECTATHICKNANDHVETEKVTATYEVVKEPTAGAKGLGRYTATFMNDAFAVQTKDVEIEMLAPIYADATYTWADDNSTVTAEKKCLNGGADITETVNTIYSVTKEPNCEEAGTGVYTATFSNSAFAEQTKNVAIDSTGHDWNAPTYSWTAIDGGYKCTATRTCNNGSHPETEEVTATYEVVTAPTAGAKGLGRYTATFENDAFATQTKDVELEMLAPIYADATYTWADDNSSVTAEKKCLNGGANLTETVNTTSQITKPATCKAMGETTYYATFTNEMFTAQEKTVANIEKTAHTPAEAVVENRVEPTYDTDGSYDSVVYCSECSEELSRETIVIPKLNKTEVIINSVDINGNSTKTTVFAETYTSADYTVPSAPYMDGYNFSGWKVNDTLYTTADGVKTAVAALVAEKPETAVTVAVVYEQKVETYTVNVENGTLDNGVSGDSYQAGTELKVTAAPAEEGFQFDHWENNGAIASYNEVYSFHVPSKDTTLTAVYSPAENQVEKAGTAFIESVTTVSGNKLAFVSKLSVPEGARMLKAGIVANTEAELNGAELTADTAKFTRFDNSSCYNYLTFKYTWTKSNVGESDVWCVRSYLVYSDENGEEHTVYGDFVRANLNGIITE